MSYDLCEYNHSHPGMRRQSQALRLAIKQATNAQPVSQATGRARSEIVLPVQVAQRRGAALVVDRFDRRVRPVVAMRDLPFGFGAAASDAAQFCALLPDGIPPRRPLSHREITPRR